MWKCHKRERQEKFSCASGCEVRKGDITVCGENVGGDKDYYVVVSVMSGRGTVGGETADDEEGASLHTATFKKLVSGRYVSDISSISNIYCISEFG